MKTKRTLLTVLAVAIAGVILYSCGSAVTLTSWKDPNASATVTNVVVFPLFKKLEYMKPFETAMVSYFNSKGLKAIGSLDFLNPTVKYESADIMKKIDSLGANGLLVFSYTGTDTTHSYVPPTYYGGGYYGWDAGYWGGGYWGPYWGGDPYWGDGYWDGGVATGGYWTTTSTVNLKAMLFVKNSKNAIWTGDITVTDPNYVDQSATTIAQDIYNNWLKDQLVTPPVK